MKALLNKGWIILIALFVGIASCGKDNTTKPDTTTPVVKTKTELIIPTPWKLLKVEEFSNGVWVNYNFGTAEVWTFKTGGALTIAKGATVKNRKWKFMANETQIDVDVDSPDVYDVTTLTETSMVLTAATRARATFGK
ncbi:MAG: hypothetical protein ACOYMZ_01005 [Minisyncoccia bacterium]